MSYAKQELEILREAESTEDWPHIQPDEIVGYICGISEGMAEHIEHGLDVSRHVAALSATLIILCAKLDLDLVSCMKNAREENP